MSPISNLLYLYLSIYPKEKLHFSRVLWEIFLFFLNENDDYILFYISEFIILKMIFIAENFIKMLDIIIILSVIL